MSIKVLILDEDPQVLSAITYAVHACHPTLELIVASSCTEAEVRLPSTDIAIIDVMKTGREIARIACNELHIPVIATGALPDHIVPKDTDLLRFVTKPRFDLGKISRDLGQMIEIVNKKRQAAEPFEKMDFSRN